MANVSNELRILRSRLHIYKWSQSSIHSDPALNGPFCDKASLTPAGHTAASGALGTREKLLQVHSVIGVCVSSQTLDLCIVFDFCLPSKRLQALHYKVAMWNKQQLNLLPGIGFGNHC
jgi:hypothetical protein